MKFIQVELFISVLLILISKGHSLKMNQPDFITPLRNLTIEVGRNATFECFVTGIEKYRVGWIKADTKAIQAIGRHVISNNPRISVSHDETRSKFRLHISGVTLEDAGPYMCQINSMPVRKQSGYLTVIQPSDITKITGDKVVNEGGVVILTCEAEGYPPPTIYWTREHRDEMISIWMNGRRLQVDRVENKTLELRKVTRSQMGSYLCIATNGYPPAVSKKVHLKVNFRPVITIAEPRIVIRPNEDVSMECIFEFHPRGLIWWERESGEILSRNDKYSVADYILNEFTIRSRLIIRNFQPSDVGKYTCVGRNVFNKEGDREQGDIFVSFVKTSTERTTTKEESPERHQQYEYTVPVIKTMEEATTTNFYEQGKFQQIETEVLEERNHRKSLFNKKQDQASSRHFYFNGSSCWPRPQISNGLFLCFLLFLFK